jgi:hypothetical protein
MVRRLRQAALKVALPLRRIALESFLIADHLRAARSHRRGTAHLLNNALRILDGNLNPFVMSFHIKHASDFVAGRVTNYYPCKV